MPAGTWLTDGCLAGLAANWSPLYSLPQWGCLSSLSRLSQQTGKYWRIVKFSLRVVDASVSYHVGTGGAVCKPGSCTQTQILFQAWFCSEDYFLRLTYWFKKEKWMDGREKKGGGASEKKNLKCEVEVHFLETNWFSVDFSQLLPPCELSWPLRRKKKITTNRV